MAQVPLSGSEGTTAVSGIIGRMANYTPQTKKSARAAQQAAERTRSACGALGIEGNPRYLYAAFFFELLAQVAGGIADDPPRRDFAVSTRVRPRFATPQYIEATTPADRVLLATAQAADSAELYLAAHLRAFERMQGAHNAGRQPEARQRTQEAIDHAHSSGRALHILGEQTLEMSEYQQKDERIPRPREGRPRLPDVNREALAILFLGGLRIRDLEKVLQGTRLEDAVIAPNRFAEASTAFLEFGSEMADWTPPPASDISL